MVLFYRYISTSHISTYSRTLEGYTVMLNMQAGFNIKLMYLKITLHLKKRYSTILFSLKYVSPYTKYEIKFCTLLDKIR